MSSNAHAFPLLLLQAHQSRIHPQCAVLTNPEKASTWRCFSPQPAAHSTTQPGARAGCFLMGALEMVHAICSLLALALVQERTEPGMRSPLLSRSLADFWAHRWNVPTTKLLRSCVYLPVQALLSGDGSTPQRRSTPDRTSAARAAAGSTGHAARNGAAPEQAPAQSTRLRARQQAAGGAHGALHNGNATTEGSNGVNGRAKAHAEAAGQQRGTRAWHRGIAGICTFAVSGMVHVWIHHLMRGGARLDWRWGAFFAVQPLCIAAQQLVQRSWPWRHTIGRVPAIHRCAATRATFCSWKPASLYV